MPVPWEGLHRTQTGIFREEAEFASPGGGLGHFRHREQHLLQRGRAWRSREASGMRGDGRDEAGMAARASQSPTHVLCGVAWILCRWKKKLSDRMGFFLNEHFASGVELVSLGVGGLILETPKPIWEVWLARVSDDKGLH